MLSVMGGGRCRSDSNDQRSRKQRGQLPLPAARVFFFWRVLISRTGQGRSPFFPPFLCGARCSKLSRSPSHNHHHHSHLGLGGSHSRDVSQNFAVRPRRNVTPPTCF